MGNQLTKMPTRDGMPSSAAVTAVSTLWAFSIGHSVLSLAGTVVVKAWPEVSSPFTCSPWKVTLRTWFCTTSSLNLE